MGQGSMIAGRAPPWDINVVVEISLRGDSPASDAAGAGRLRQAAPCHPGNYGFVPDTLMPDGEPVEALVVGSVSVLPGAILRSRPIGVVELADDDGPELTRLLAVPLERLHPFFTGTTSYRSLPAGLLDEIAEFFVNFRDCERSRPLRLARWGEADEAAQVMEAAIVKHRLDLAAGKIR